MPHRERLRNIRVNMFDNGLRNVAQSVIPGLRLRKISNMKKMKEAAKIRRNLVESLKEMKENQEQYGFGPIQLKVLDILTKQTRKAKSEEDLIDVWRKTRFLKNGKK